MSVNYAGFGLDGKVAIVTGPSQGIGRAIAVGLAKAGADVVLAPRPNHDRAAIESLTEEIHALGRRTLLVSTDVTQVEQVRAMVTTANNTFGRVDILINNAGWTCTGPAIDATEEDYDATMAATTKSVFFACQAAARVMIPQGGGRIINIGSNFAISAFKTRAIYGGAKAAVHQLSRALSLEWARDNVVVNVVAPCITETESRRAILERPGYKEWVAEKLPIGRWNQPEDVVGAVLFLCSDMARQVVGHVLYVDGGWTIH
ncbi:MAG: SDR family oxidoreductase [Acidobacteria bacterium]|nr:SDR family oxidoreductase [Acidobacteriota bacterium]